MKRPFINHLLFFIILPFLVVSCKSAPRFGKSAELPPPNFKLRALPIFMIPEVDVKNQNDLTTVFIYRENNNTVSITVIFQDEDHPSWFTDHLYDLYRRFKYKRKMDVETFKLIYPENADIGKDNPKEISFPDTYSESQVFLTKNVKHYSRSVPFSSFTVINGRPVIYVNTWNHMFSEKNNNLNLKLVVRKDYPVYWGNRRDVEKLF